ncbi:MAG TPA: acyl-CoA synthetase FdrA [Burkholderiales bacterium]|nr:acyl-CoA synthetase FdrA [Burkholderiales bacterium]
MYIQRLLPNLYRDSVSLMQLSAALGKLPGVEQASAVMATPGNLEFLRQAGLVDGDIAPRPNDLLVAVRGKSTAQLEAALASALSSLNNESARDVQGVVAEAPLRSLQMALARSPAANLALISVPGDYAAAEAMKALRLGLHVMLFSDNVALADEVALKRYADGKGLLVMGPDCGTAIVDGVPLGFANAVRRGAVGVVGASGTGMQQVTSLVHRRGGGISHAIGTGGHDLGKDVGGITMLRGLALLARDEDTKAIVLISKPPSPAIAREVIAAARKAGKPVVINFIGSTDDPSGGNLHVSRTLDDAASAAVALAKGRKPSRASSSPLKLPKLKFKRGQRYIRGLFSGGTFCYEASALLGDVWSNAPVDPKRAIEDPWKSREHTLIDLGDDVFTRGRPHPMIDLRLRNERMLEEAADPQVAVILLDVVLGYGSHADPAAELVPTIEKAQGIGRKKGRNLAVVASVCGTDEDPQGLEREEAALREAGVLLTESNASAARLAGAIVAKLK